MTNNFTDILLITVSILANARVSCFEYVVNTHCFDVNILHLHFL